MDVDTALNSHKSVQGNTVTVVSHLGSTLFEVDIRHTISKWPIFMKITNYSFRQRIVVNLRTLFCNSIGFITH